MWWATIIAYGYYGSMQVYASVLKILEFNSWVRFFVREKHHSISNLWGLLNLR